MSGEKQLIKENICLSKTVYKGKPMSEKEQITEERAYV